MKKFSLFNHELRRLAAENPDKTAQCSLFKPDGKTPQCIAGHAFVALGVGLSVTQNGDEDSSLRIGDKVVGTASDPIPRMDFNLLGFRKPTGKQLQWAALVQEYQDNGSTWSHAVACADEDIKEYVNV